MWRWRGGRGSGAYGGSGRLSFSHDLSTDSRTGAHFDPAAYLAFVEAELATARRPLNATLLLAGALANGTTNALLVRSLHDRLVDQAVGGLTLQHLQLSTTHVGADMPAFEEAAARYFE